MKQNIKALLIFISLTAIVTWPLVLNLDTKIIDQVDGLLITWIMNWDIHALTSGVNIFNANIFYPYTKTLAFSDYHLLGAVIALPFVKIFGEPLLAFNINFLLGFILSGFSIYLLVKYITKDYLAALFCGILFAFSPIHLNYLAHLQIFSIWPVVLAILFLLQKRFWSFGIVLVICGLQSPLLVYFLIAVLTIFYLLNLTNLSNLIKPIFIATIVLGFLLLPFFLVSREWHYVRPINDAIHFSLQIPDLVNWPRDGGARMWPGIITTIFVICLIRQIGPIWRQKHFKFFGILAVVSFVLALGPALHIFQNTVRLWFLPGIPLPYAILYYLVPGFSGFRTPSRWIVLCLIALVVLIGIYLKGRINKKIFVILAVLVLFEVSRPMKFYDVPKVRDFPEEQVWLSKNYMGSSIIQFPIYGWWDSELKVETTREYYSTIHWHPMYNGYSGFSPKEWEDNVKWLQREFPSEVSINFLKSKGIKLVVVSSKIYEIQEDSKLKVVSDM